MSQANTGISYKYLTDKDVEDGTEIMNLMQELGEIQQTLVMTYARGLRDMQNVSKIKIT